jgi:hypothetical protein
MLALRAPCCGDAAGLEDEPCAPAATSCANGAHQLGTAPSSPSCRAARTPTRQQQRADAALAHWTHRPPQTHSGAIPTKIRLAERTKPAAHGAAVAPAGRLRRRWRGRAAWCAGAHVIRARARLVRSGDTGPRPDRPAVTPPRRRARAPSSVPSLMGNTDAESDAAWTAGARWDAARSLHGNFPLVRRARLRPSREAQRPAGVGSPPLHM